MNELRKGIKKHLLELHWWFSVHLSTFIGIQAFGNIVVIDDRPNAKKESHKADAFSLFLCLSTLCFAQLAQKLTTSHSHGTPVMNITLVTTTYC